MSDESYEALKDAGEVLAFALAAIALIVWFLQ